MKKEIESIINNHGYSLGCYDMKGISPNYKEILLKRLDDMLEDYETFNIVIEDIVVEIEKWGCEIDVNFTTLQKYYDNYGEFPE